MRGVNGILSGRSSSRNDATASENSSFVAHAKHISVCACRIVGSLRDDVRTGLTSAWKTVQQMKSRVSEIFKQILE